MSNTPTEFREVMDTLLANITESFVLIKVFVTVKKGNQAESKKIVRELLKTLDTVKFQLKEEKCKIAQKAFE